MKQGCGVDETRTFHGGQAGIRIHGRFAEIQPHALKDCIGIRRVDADRVGAEVVRTLCLSVERGKRPVGEVLQVPSHDGIRGSLNGGSKDVPVVRVALFQVVGQAVFGVSKASSKTSQIVVRSRFCACVAMAARKSRVRNPASGDFDTHLNRSSLASVRPELAGRTKTGCFFCTLSSQAQVAIESG
jgi:hypothetical protein